MDCLCSSKHLATVKRGQRHPSQATREQPQNRVEKAVCNPKQASTTVTSKSGAQITLYRHQQFATCEQGKLFIRQLALAQGKRVLIDGERRQQHHVCRQAQDQVHLHPSSRCRQVEVPTG